MVMLSITDVVSTASPGTRRVIVGAKYLPVGTEVVLVEAPWRSSAIEIDVEQCIRSCDQSYIPVSDFADQWPTENDHEHQHHGIVSVT